jgi:hypothetical protein
MRAATVLKQASANAAESATEDQASDHSHQTNPRRPEFELDITEEAPTTSQLQTILNYAGKQNIGSIIKGATSDDDAFRKFKESTENFKRPVVCLPWLDLSHCAID